MTRIHRIRWLPTLVLALVLALAAGHAATAEHLQPTGLFLTWQREADYRTYAGPAWYRRTIDLPEKPGNLEPDQLDAVELAFEGVDEMAWVWVNGSFVGQHAIGPEGWETPFALPVTDAVKWGEPNQVTIMAESTQDGGGVHGEVRFELLRVTSE